MKWEYCELHYVRVGGLMVVEDMTGKKNIECNRLALILDDLGQQGWELVNVIDGVNRTDTTVFYFKRPARIRIILIDRRTTFRTNMKFALEAEGDIVIVAESDNGRDAVDLYARYSPDIMLADINLHEIDAIAAADMIQHRYKRANIMIIGADKDVDSSRAPGDSGARLFFSEVPTKPELLATIRNIAKSSRSVIN